jgi:hypothetical protein
VRGFYDPSVNFELEFDVKSDGAVSADQAPPPKLETAPASPAKKAEPKKKPAEAAKDAAAAAEAGSAKGADVVSLDAFRKK